ncbi:MAG: hypothetical protein JF617_11090 [Burkholderiales bacterium]|nr:hypothetical protein [Burkholderiales bacterium]
MASRFHQAREGLAIGVLHGGAGAQRLAIALDDSRRSSSATYSRGQSRRLALSAFQRSSVALKPLDTDPRNAFSPPAQSFVIGPMSNEILPFSRRIISKIDIYLHSSDH